MTAHRKTRLQLAHLRSWRTLRLMTQQELADGAGISISTIVRIEAAQGQANIATIRSLAHALGVTPEQLAFGDPPPMPEAVGAR